MHFPYRDISRCGFSGRYSALTYILPTLLPHLPTYIQYLSTSLPTDLHTSLPPYLLYQPTYMYLPTLHTSLSPSYTTYPLPTLPTYPPPPLTTYLSIHLSPSLPTLHYLPPSLHYLPPYLPTYIHYLPPFLPTSLHYLPTSLHYLHPSRHFLPPPYTTSLPPSFQTAGYTDGNDYVKFINKSF